MVAKKILSEKEIAKKIKDLKIELLKSPTKRGRVKKEIARLLTMVNQESKNKTEGKLEATKSKWKFVLSVVCLMLLVFVVKLPRHSKTLRLRLKKDASEKLTR